MQSHVDPILESLGLGGDGDEIEAIQGVERAFDVKLDYSGAAGWRTVGDVHSALKAALPPEQCEADDLWPRFSRAISGETAVDPARVGPTRLLLAQGKLGWLAIILLIAIVAAIAIVAHWR